MESFNNKAKRSFLITAITILCMLLSVVVLGCSANTSDDASDKTNHPENSGTAKPEINAKKLFNDAQTRFDEYNSVEFDFKCNITLGSDGNTVVTVLSSRVGEKNRNTQDFQMTESSVLRIGSQEAMFSEIVYIDGKYYSDCETEKFVSDLTFEEYCDYINEGKQDNYGTDTIEDSYDNYDVKSYLDGSVVSYDKCNTESSYLKGEIVSALYLCGFDIKPSDVSLIESSGYMELSSKKDINKEERVISAEITLFNQKIRVTVLVEIDVISFNENVDIVAPTTDDYCIVPHPSFPDELNGLYCSLVDKKYFTLTDEKEVKFVVNNTQATYTDENKITYSNTDADCSFDIDFSQTIKCSKLSPKTTTNEFSESFSAATGKYVAYENEDKVSEVEISKEDAQNYIWEQLLYLVPDYMLFDSITVSIAEDGSVSTYTFELSEEYVQAYCAYYITYYDSSLSGYPYDSKSIDPAKGQIIIIADETEGVIKNVMTSMSCKYNYQNKYTISFTYSGILECDIEK